MKFNVVEILSEYNIFYEKESNDALNVKCPFHGDNNPSGVVFTKTGVFHCRVCDKNRNFFRFLNKRLGKDVYFEVHQKFADIRDKVISPDTIELAHAAIFEDCNKQLRQALYDRKLNDDDIRKYRLGVQRDRITIPIRNASKFYVNLRRYKPGASEKKFLNMPGYGDTPRLFPIEQLQYDTIVFTGGEPKAIPATRILNSHGIGALCCTHGEKTLPNEIITLFEGKIIYFGLDLDETGKNWAVRHALRLQSIASWIGIIEWPLDTEKYPKGDLNDFLASGGDLLKIIEETPKWEFQAETEFELTEEAKEVTLSESVLAENTGKRVELKAVISTLSQSPYPLPKEVNIVCDRSEKFCDLCQVSKMHPNHQQLEISPESPSLIKMLGETDKIQHEAIKSAFKIPQRCKQCSFNPLTYYNIEEARISESLSLQATTTERSMQAALCIGNSLELNEIYKMKGRMFPHPKTQEATLILSSYEPTQDALSTYKPAKEEELKIFQPAEWTFKGVKEKLNEIYSDLEANITKIFKRREIHLAVDLTYHSPLFITFDSSKVKGWTEILLLGDSAQGKSQVSLTLQEHYGLGEKVDCKGATRAGLLGGQESFNKRWFITWGKIPMNDRGLVILEELKGVSVEVFSKLTEMRSTGFAEIAGIVKRKTHARTRILANSNPRKPRPLSSYNYGIDAIVELIGNLEDLRRFDMCLVVERNEIDAGELESFRPEQEHKFTAELCRELILWAWTIKEVQFEDESRIFEASKKLSELFTNEIPIVDRGSMRFKIARLAAALAARTFSYEGEILMVRNCHIEYIEDFLINTYSTDAFGYAQFSQVSFEAEKLVNPASIRHRITTKIEHPKEFVEHMLLADEVDSFFLQDLLGLPPDVARNLLSFFIRQRALRKEDKRYRKTLEFTNLLKKMRSEDLRDDPPNHLKNEEF